MTSVGNIGRPVAVSGPKSSTITEALNLLSVFGGGDQKVRDQLTELHAAITHNEALLAQLQDIERREAEVSRRERELAETEVRVDAELAQYRRILTNVGEYLEKEPEEISRKVDEAVARVLKPSASNEKIRPRIDIENGA